MGYDEARRIWNGLFDRLPALIVQCLDAADVSAVVCYAREGGHRVTVRGGGHNVAGRSIADDAILIDLGLMRDVAVDVDARMATAGGGCLLRDLDEATGPHELACPSGVVSHTGLGGLALGGGYGWLARRWGLTCDHIVAAEVVLADGSIVLATEGAEPDLLWALRGGGGSFGIVTQFVLKLRPVGRVHLRRLVFHLDGGIEALAAYAAFAEGQPPDLNVVGGLGWAPDDAWIPSPLRGQPALVLKALWLGDPREGRAATEPLVIACSPAASIDDVIPFVAVQAMADESEPAGNRYYTKSCYLDTVSAETATHMVEAIGAAVSERSALDLAYLRGAIADAPVPSAFPHRAERFMFTASAQWVDPRDDLANLAWAKDAVDRLGPLRRSGVYVNYAEVGTALDATAGVGKHGRLEHLKHRYDHDGLLQGHQPIRPRATERGSQGCE